MGVDSPQVRWAGAHSTCYGDSFGGIVTQLGESPRRGLAAVLLILFMTPIVQMVTLFAEPRVGKTQAKRLEGDLRNPRNCRFTYPLLAGTTAVTQSLSWLRQQL